jgi:hypothetical protein
LLLPLLLSRPTEFVEEIFDVCLWIGHDQDVRVYDAAILFVFMSFVSYEVCLFVYLQAITRSHKYHGMMRLHTANGLVDACLLKRNGNTQPMGLAPQPPAHPPRRLQRAVTTRTRRTTTIDWSKPARMRRRTGANTIPTRSIRGETSSATHATSTAAISGRAHSLHTTRARMDTSSWLP